MTASPAFLTGAGGCWGWQSTAFHLQTASGLEKRPLTVNFAKLSLEEDWFVPGVGLSSCLPGLATQWLLGCGSGVAPTRAGLVPIRQLALPVHDLCSWAVCLISGDGIGPTQLSDLLKKVKLHVILTRQCVRGSEFERCRVYTVNASLLPAWFSSPAAAHPCQGAHEHLLLVRKDLNCPLDLLPFGSSSFILESPQGQPGASLWRLRCVFERALETWDLLATFSALGWDVERISVADLDPSVDDSQSLVPTVCVLLVLWFRWSAGNS